MGLVRVIFYHTSEQLKKLSALCNMTSKKIVFNNKKFSSYLPQVFTNNFEKTDNILKHNKTINNLRQWHEEFTGLDEVRNAQNRVLEAENKFIAAQEKRRTVNNKLATIQNRLREIYAELDKTKRGEERYVFLITQEHSILKEEQFLAKDFMTCEREEREQFSILSSALKESHEKERLQAERTKYWSIIGSVIGTVIGILGSSIISEMRMRELRILMNGSAGAVNEQLSQVVGQLQQQQLQQSKQIQLLGDAHNSLNKYNKEVPSNADVDLNFIVELMNEQKVSNQQWTLSAMVVIISVVYLAFKSFAGS